jgi:gas vesicle structural protein
MAIQKAPASSSLIDVLDRVLDKGIVIAAWVRVSVVGIDVITVSARITVASIETYLAYAGVLGASPQDDPQPVPTIGPAQYLFRR